ncbi:MAG: response regulator transcription factor [Chloroflexota bacterium]|nr:response regulator transcription factor [Chloroflexota bacterium]
MTDTIRVLLVDDYPLFRAGVESALDETEDIRVIGFADHTADASHLCEQLRPDVLLYSARPRDILALDLVRSLHEQYPTMKILVLADSQQSERALEALADGASGVLLKGDPLPLLERAIRTIHRGGVSITPSIVPSAAKAPEPPPSLTERERVVLNLMARGWDNATIAAELELKVQTVRNYTSRIYQKLQVQTRDEAVVWALEHGFGGPSS